LAQRHVVVNVYDSDNRVIIPDEIEATSLNTLTITFSSPVTGTAIASIGSVAVVPGSGPAGNPGTSGTSGVDGSVGAISGSINIVLYNGGSDLTTGVKDHPVLIPYSASATGWDILAFNSSNTLVNTSAVVDILSDTFVNLPLSATDSIAGTEKPTLNSISASRSSSLSTWSQLTPGNYLQAEIESVGSGVAKLVVAVRVRRI